ncbi:hypothetical protein Slin15195_G024690 [Septoria linicola]|uniref:Uncharacterized protein n=1 Tax=Septoria linicola TaxID=215465 RepID=A0A9Q9AMH7_9PEZI|nr:hypothetical protein Slin14017_G023780 [Septoria linicola]USW49150.1 hypothetical protein Slin15195_G024690 [Septoria linicola]
MLETVSSPPQLTHANASNHHHNIANYPGFFDPTPAPGVDTTNPGLRAHHLGFGHTQRGADHNTVRADSGLSFDDLSGITDDLNSSQGRIPDAPIMAEFQVSEAAYDSPQHGHQFSPNQLPYSAHINDGGPNYFPNHLEPPQGYAVHPHELQQHPASIPQLGQIVNEAATFPQPKMPSNGNGQRLQLPSQTLMPTLHSANQAQSIGSQQNIDQARHGPAASSDPQSSNSHPPDVQMAGSDADPLELETMTPEMIELMWDSYVAK